MSVTDLRLSLGPLGEVSATHYGALDRGADPRPCLVLAHGAGANHRHRFFTTYAADLAARGVEVVTFNFLYTEHGKHSPDPAALLEHTWAAALESVVETIPTSGRLVVGGKSMGGRIASQVLAQPAQSAVWQRVSGLVLLGYPLHPPGQPAKARVAHLPSIAAPILVVQGTRDAFGTRAEVEPVFTALPTRVDFEWIEGGDHSFVVPKSSGRSADDVRAVVCDRVATWIGG
jgi:predicted alpha/beta-hydrolase family hydrolase